MRVQKLRGGVIPKRSREEKSRDENRGQTWARFFRVTFPSHLSIVIPAPHSSISLFFSLRGACLNWYGTKECLFPLLPHSYRRFRPAVRPLCTRVQIEAEEECFSLPLRGRLDTKRRWVGSGCVKTKRRRNEKRKSPTNLHLLCLHPTRAKERGNGLSRESFF